MVENRPMAVEQEKLAEIMNNSPRVLQLRALSNAIHNSLRKVAQRHEMSVLASGAVESRGDGVVPAESSPALREENPNNTGLPNQLKSGLESLSGMSMDHVKVRYHSDKPAQLQAHAYAQGRDIHLAPGQENTYRTRLGTWSSRHRGGSGRPCGWRTRLPSMPIRVWSVRQTSWGKAPPL